MEIVKLTKQVRALEDNLSDTNKKLMKADREKGEAV